MTNTNCGLANGDPNYFAFEVDVTGQCTTGQKKDGSSFFYKASAARCFKWYAEFPTEGDCQNNKNEVTQANQINSYLIGIANDANAMDKACRATGSQTYRTTCNTFGNGAKVEAEADKTFVIE